jgi:hypothetical protein
MADLIIILAAVTMVNLIPLIGTLFIGLKEALLVSIEGSVAWVVTEGLVHAKTIDQDLSALRIS